MEKLLFSSVSDGTYSIHKADSAPNPVAHDIPSVEYARLFAASPEMLAVLREFVSDVDAVFTDENLADEWPDLAVTYQKAKDIIFKAVQS